MKETHWIFDAHLDLSMNAIEWNRDLTRPIQEVRAREAGLKDKPDRGLGTITLPEMRRGRIGICVATQIARYVAPDNPLPGWFSPHQAWAQTQGQLAWYRAMEEAGEMRQIRTRSDLEAHVRLWESPTLGHEAIGYILSLEGADSILTPKHLERAYEQGLRAVGPAHYGPGRYAMGTDATGGLRPGGKELLNEMSRLGIILDVTHLCDDSLVEALDHYEGPLWASHSNCRALVNHNRQFSDEQIRLLIQRGAVIGGALDAWMIVPDWIRGVTTPANSGVLMRHVVDHIDHVCQLAGNADHSGIGSDLDGAFGREQSPGDLDTIADLQSFADLFRERGYSESDVAKIMNGNFTRFLLRNWKA